MPTFVVLRAILLSWTSPSLILNPREYLHCSLHPSDQLKDVLVHALWWQEFYQQCWFFLVQTKHKTLSADEWLRERAAHSDILTYITHQFSQHVAVDHRPSGTSVQRHLTVKVEQLSDTWIEWLQFFVVRLFNEQGFAVLSNTYSIDTSLPDDWERQTTEQQWQFLQRGFRIYFQEARSTSISIVRAFRQYSGYWNPDRRLLPTYPTKRRWYPDSVRVLDAVTRPPAWLPLLHCIYPPLLPSAPCRVLSDSTPDPLSSVEDDYVCSPSSHSSMAHWYRFERHV